MHWRRTSAFIGLCLLTSAAASALPPDPEAVTDPQGIARIAPGEVLVLGEMHGSKETPAAFLALVDRLLTRAKMVSVGLEMPSNAARAGCGTAVGAAVGRFWTRKTQDGRSSEAMRALVCQLKSRAAAGKVRLLYLDTEPRDPEETVRRVATEAGSKSHPMAVLIGNYHARNASDSFVGRVRARGITVTSLTASSPDVTTWNCTSDGCGSRPMQMKFCPDQAKGPYLLTKMPPGSRWDACMVLPRLTSSPPAIAAK
jgi:hypothetical protein